MNFKHTIKALAAFTVLCAASSALAVTTVKFSEDFESYDVNPFPGSSGTTFTITTLPVEGTAAVAPTNCPLDVSSSYSLVLNTEGEDLSFDLTALPQADQLDANSTTLIDALVQLKSSDAPPDMTGDAAHTAVYLHMLEDLTGAEPVTNYTLRAWLSGNNEGGGEPAWVDLTAPAGVTLADESWYKLTVKIDYTGATPLVSVYLNDNACTAFNGETQYVCANSVAAKAQGKVNEVAFRGTGLVDNFAVSQEVAAVETITVTQNYLDGNGDALITATSATLSISGLEILGSPEAIAGYNATAWTVTKDGVQLATGTGDGNVLLASCTGYEPADGDALVINYTYAPVTMTFTVEYVSSVTGGYTPADETFTVAYGSTFTKNVASLLADGETEVEFFEGAIVGDVVESGLEGYDYTYAAVTCTDTAITYANVTYLGGDVTITVTGIFAEQVAPAGTLFGSGDDSFTVDADEEVAFTAVSTTAFTFTAPGSIGSGTMAGIQLAVLTSSDLTDTLTPVAATVTTAAEDNGEITVTATLPANAFADDDTVFFRGISSTIPAQN